MTTGRNLIRNKGYSSINIIGLAAGMAVFLTLLSPKLNSMNVLLYSQNHEINNNNKCAILFQY
jgi:hypothetical protein